MVKMYVKKPIPIAVIQWTGENIDEVNDFMGNCVVDKCKNTLSVCTLEGELWAFVGDYILKGVNGEFYPCKEEIFKKTYIQVSD